MSNINCIMDGEEKQDRLSFKEKLELHLLQKLKEKAPRLSVYLAMLKDRNVNPDIAFRDIIPVLAETVIKVV